MEQSLKMHTAIYYPHFEPPKAWLRRCLLLYDCLHTIVPNDAKKDLSADFVATAGELGDDLKTVEPHSNYVKADDFRIERLDKAFEWISQCRAQSSETQSVDIGSDNKLSFDGVSFMHDGKLSVAILELLKKHNLIGEALNTVANEVKPENYHAVDQTACQVILSHIADRMSRRNGWSVLSDEQIGIATATLNAFEPPRRETAVRLLANAIIRVGVPAEINDMSLKEYVELRKGFRSLRETFHAALFQITDSSGLANIDDPAHLEEKVSAIAKDFESSMLKFRQKKSMQRFRDWLPFCINTITQLSSLIFTNPASLFAFTTANISVGLFQELSKDVRWNSPVTETQRLFASVQDRVFDTALIRRLQ